MNSKGGRRGEKGLAIYRGKRDRRLVDLRGEKEREGEMEALEKGTHKKCLKGAR